MTQLTQSMINSGFNYYDPNRLQLSVVSQHLVEHIPYSALQQNTPIEFNLWGALCNNEYLDLSHSYFQFQVRVRAADDSVPEAADEVSCVQNLAHSMFQRIDIMVNGTCINEQNSLYPYRAFFADLLSRNSEVQKSSLPLQGWTSRDVAGAMVNLHTTGNGHSPTAAERHALIGTGQTIELIMKPHLELFNSDKLIPPELKLQVRFTPAPGAFVIKKGAGAKNFKLQFMDAKFYCSYVKATTTQHTACLRALQALPARISFTRVTLKQLTIAQGQTVAGIQNIYSGPVPNRIILAMNTDTAVAGSHISNPFNFQHFGLNGLSLQNGAEVIPATAYNPNWDAGLYKRLYMDTMMALNKGSNERPFTLTLHEFANGYSIFSFDLTPDHNDQETLSTAGTGVIRLNLTFGTPLAAAVCVILYAEFDSGMKIDSGYNVIANFNT